MVVIIRQQILQDITLFTSQPKAKFYDELFMNLDLSLIKHEMKKTGRPKTDTHNLIRSFIVMKCEGFSMITDLLDYLTNNLLIAYYCGFNIMKPLPSYSVFERFIKNFDNHLLKELMQSQVKDLAYLGIINTNFISLDSTPIKANTSHNNPKSFKKNKYSKDLQPKSDKDCGLGVYASSNQSSEKKFEFYWGYKNHILIDSVSGLPIYETFTKANVYDSSVVTHILEKSNAFLPLEKTCFIADKAYDTKNIYNFIKEKLNGEAFIPINPRGSKGERKILKNGSLICDAGFAMHKDGRQFLNGSVKQKFCCPFRTSKDNSLCSCNHKLYNNGKKNRGCTKYISYSNDYRGSINRESLRFKTIYSLRSESERYNSRLKGAGLERLWVRNINSARNMISLAHITLLAVAKAAVITNNSISFKAVKSLKRAA